MKQRVFLSALTDTSSKVYQFLITSLYLHYQVLVDQLNTYKRKHHAWLLGHLTPDWSQLDHSPWNCDRHRLAIVALAPRLNALLVLSRVQSSWSLSVMEIPSGLRTRRAIESPSAWLLSMLQRPARGTVVGGPPRSLRVWVLGKPIKLKPQTTDHRPLQEVCCGGL